jgi:kynureninase
VVATDSTSINLYKVLSAALNMAREDAPQRKTVVSERSNFPTDLYIAEGLCRSAAAPEAGGARGDRPLR